MQLVNNSNFYLFDKPITWTSQDLCTKIKKNFKFNKVGHSGTLDPNAKGLMLVAIDGYTKLFDYIDNTNKSYLVTALLGYSSPTLDIDSEVILVKKITSKKYSKEINEFLTNLLGKSSQTPPIYSAIKVKGKRLYKYARQNKVVDIPSRDIYVSNIDVHGIYENKVVFEISVSKGTYIRSIVSDLGKYLGTSAIVESLERIKIGNIDNSNISLVKNVEALNSSSKISALDWKEVINIPYIDLDSEYYQNIKNGQLLPKNLFKNNKKNMISISNKIVAVYKPFDSLFFKPEKVLI